MTTKTKTPVPVSETVAETIASGGDNVTPLSAGQPTNIFAAMRANVSESVQHKLQEMQVIRQRLAEAADLFSEGKGREAEASEIADDAALRLYQARADGLVSNDEISGVLRDIFGAVPRKDGTPGNTPAGQGAHIRKRIVRAVNALEYVTNGDGGRFFEGLPEGEVEDALNRLKNGGSIWSAYEDFADIRKAHMVRTNAAFDPKRIGAIVESLSEEGAAKMIAENPALVEAYAALLDVLNVLGEEAAKLAEAA